MKSCKKNQLFRIFPSEELLQKICCAFGFRSLNDRRCFSRTDLVKLKTVEKVQALKSELEKCYLPCKARTYLNDLTEKNVVTVIRQCLKTRNLTIISREKYCKGDKFIIYNICPIDQKKYISVIANPYENRSFPVIVDFN